MASLFTKLLRCFAKLKLWTDDSCYVIAETETDAYELTFRNIGPDLPIGPFKKIDDTAVIEIYNTDTGILTTKLASDWIMEHGRGYLLSLDRWY